MRDRRPVVRRVAAAAFCVALVVACGPPKYPSNPHAVDRICNTLCDRRVSCDPSWEAQACQTDCRTRASHSRPYWRDDYVEAATRCLASVDCPTILSDRRRAKACWRDTRPEPTALARHFCEVAGERDRFCNGRPPQMDGCLREWGKMNDAILQAALECQSLTCRHYGSCARSIVEYDKDDEEKE